MKRIVLLLAATAAMAAGSAFAGHNGSAGAPVHTDDLPINGARANHGQVLCTAAVNSDGSKAGGLGAATTASLATGEYEVAFVAPCTGITAANGWARWVQVDTLGGSSISGGVSCTTADRAGKPNAVYVECTDASGTEVNTSFFLFVVR